MPLVMCTAEASYLF